MIDEIILSAPAKINLSLRILGRRKDGYHNIVTLMQKIELADQLHIGLHAGNGIKLRCPGNDLPCDAGNIVFRAVETFCRESGIDQGIEVVLEKRIPVAAGLGGGSSDAAAVLLGLNSLLATGFSLERLQEMALDLGADVPFFIRPESALWAEGIGEKFSQAAALEGCWIVLANPGFDVSTKWVYENFALTIKGNPYMVGRELRQGEKGVVLRGGQEVLLHNDLESITLKRYPEVGFIKDEFISAGAAGALMSGSGPTVFGIFFAKKPAASCLEKIKSKLKGRFFITRPF